MSYATVRDLQNGMRNYIDTNPLRRASMTNTTPKEVTHMAKDYKPEDIQCSPIRRS